MNWLKECPAILQKRSFTPVIITCIHSLTALKCHNLVSSSDRLVNNEMIIISLINIKESSERQFNHWEYALYSWN